MIAAPSPPSDSLSPRRRSGEGQGGLPLKQYDIVILLNVQCKYILLVHWGCKTMPPSNTVPSTSLNDCVSHSPIRASGRDIAVAPATSMKHALRIICGLDPWQVAVGGGTGRMHSGAGSWVALASGQNTVIEPLPMLDMAVEE